MRLTISHAKTVSLHKEFICNSFYNFERLLKAPVVIYADFGSILKLATDNKIDGPNTKNMKIILFAVMAGN